MSLFKYKEACLGGTFDHLHLGHKLLLTQAMLSVSERMLIGVTSDVLLQKKAYASYIESFDVRKNRVEEFLFRLNPRVHVDIFELSDPVGQASTDPTLDACILTREVEKGGAMVNDARKKNGLNELDLIFVEMILVEEDANDDNKFSNKTSSTHIRAYLAHEEQLHEDPKSN